MLHLLNIRLLVVAYFFERPHDRYSINNMRHLSFWSTENNRRRFYLIFEAKERVY